uniref:GAF domain-containing protein n=1 Tax=Roseihalotalea indica TaxID=2867963 RepID=A0AA49JD72_9BACT|nr:GAF domain-containing protein [Tunicatimonas sp. TK19036]
MQIKKNKLSWLLATLFITASSAVVFTLYHLPEWLTQFSPAIDLSVSQQLSPLLQRINIVVGIALGIGLWAIAMLINSQNNSFDTSSRINFSRDNDEEKNESVGTSTEGDFYLGDVNDFLSLELEPHQVFNKVLSQVCRSLEASQAAAFRVVEEDEHRVIEMFSSFAYHIPEGERVVFRFGEGIAGQVAKEGSIAQLDSVPEGYIQILSGLGSATPGHLLVIPVKEDGEVMGVVEIASFKPFSSVQVLALEAFFEKLALKLSINDNVRLEEAKQ